MKLKFFFQFGRNMPLLSAEDRKKQLDEYNSYNEKYVRNKNYFC